MLIKQNEITPEYRYFVYDLVSDTLLAEIPFTDVKYGRAIREAGRFEGTVAVTEATRGLNLYDNTMPGKTALYIVRNNVCVWGGIIWSRNYDMANRSLSVSGAEFISYFHHRAMWKTWNYNFSAAVEIVDGVASVTIPTAIDPALYPEQAIVKLSFSALGLIYYDGYYPVIPSTDSGVNFKLGININHQEKPVGDTYDPSCTVSFKVDTYSYAREILEQVRVDFSGIEFPNGVIQPSQIVRATIQSFGIAGGTGRIVTNTDGDNPGLLGIAPGQRVMLRNIKNSFNVDMSGYVTVSAVYADNSFGFTTTESDLNTSSALSNSHNVKYYAVTNVDGISVVTLKTPTENGFAVNDVVEVAGLSSDADGTYLITSVDPETYAFTYNLETVIADIIEQDVSEHTSLVTVAADILYATWGEYTANSDIGLEYYTTDPTSSGKYIKNEKVRGFQLKLAGDYLDEYSNNINGFEYRIDCEYDPTTGSFKKKFKFLPIEFPNPPVYGVSAPSRFGADKLVFEHPGNLLAVNMSESAESAATRYWVQGNIADVSSDASQPYAAATAVDYLTDGWPILDAMESLTNIYQQDKMMLYAEQYLSETLPPIANFTVTANGSIAPYAGSYSPGDWCSVLVNNDEFIRQRLLSKLELRDNILVRKIDAYEVTVPNAPSYPESVDLHLITEIKADKYYGA